MEELDQYTKEQWRAKYQLAERRAQEAAKLAGDRLEEIRSWRDMAERICIEFAIEWPQNETFAYVVIKAFRQISDKIHNKPAKNINL
jgi:hypothetical protein